MAKRYCGMCDKWVPARETVCKACGADTEKAITEKPKPQVVDLMDALRQGLPKCWSD